MNDSDYPDTEYPLCDVCQARHHRYAACDAPDVNADETGASEYRRWLQADD